MSDYRRIISVNKCKLNFMQCSKSFPFVLTFGLLWMLSSACLLGQQPVMRAIEFSCVSWERVEKDQELYYRDGSDYRTVEIGYKRRSKLHELSSGHMHLEIYEKSLNADGKMDYRLVGRGANVAGTGRVLFFLQLVSKREQIRANLFGIDDSLKAFPSGSIRFINTTSEPLQVLMNKSKVKIPPRGLSIVQPEIPELGGFLPVYIGNAQSKLVYESRFFAQPRGRKIVIVSPPKGDGGRIQLRFLSEIVAPLSTQDEVSL